MNAQALATVISSAANELRDAYDAYGATVGQILFKLDAAILADAPELTHVTEYAKTATASQLRTLATAIREENRNDPTIENAVTIVYCDAAALEKEIFAALAEQQAQEQWAERRNEEVLAGFDRYDYEEDMEDQRERANANL